ncbi:VWA domain-containing protein [Aminobacter aganoensis]|uniref:Ca-activated chloride channel family protein n=1 Tax=Aminobacter aganoensis TaxID=83264 RepID=A0A7X0FB23_9HYPH|nr:VWA domain-containing protein [Aminobacter aganoensis]MBB6356375.1 Ca-activated chloride channel family protein [Aminobacter aganoensis]
MKSFLRTILASALVLGGAMSAQAADRAIIVLDASGSMWGQIDGKPKLEIARQALRSVLTTIPADTELGLMAYGHREKGSCSDIELVVPPASGSASAITAAADSMKFLGKTPLSAAVKQAAEDLKYTEDKATVILITDGLETCSADPCALGKELEQSGVDFTAHVVGFGLTAEEGRQVACLAENTGGKYIQASDAKGLEDALAQTVAEPAPAPAPAPAPEPAKPEFNFVPELALAEGAAALKDAGNAWEIYKANADGTKGERLTTEYNNYKGSLEPGDYVIRATLGEAAVEQPLKVEAGQAYKPLFVLNAGTLIVRPRPSDGGDINTGAAVVLDFPGASHPATYYGETKIVLPAGETKVKVTIGQGEANETIQLAAGQTVEKDIIAGVGRVVVNALYAQGGDKVDAGGLDVRVYKAKKKIDGTREQVTYGYGPDNKFDLPAGDYVAVARMDQAEAEQPFNVRVGEAGDVTAVLGAGVLAIDAPGAKEIRVYAARKDIQGNRKEFGYAYDQKHQATLPEGDYVVEADLGDAGKKEGSASVKAGERTELTVQ